MADHGTAIEWTQAPGYKGETWNPVTGCDRVSPGCAHCYALDVAASNQRKERGRVAKAEREGKPAPKLRYQRDGDPRTSGPGFGLTLHPDKLEEPLRWRKPRMVFVNSMSDLFHEEIPGEFIAEVFAVMACAPQHRFLVLTKRPERMRDLLTDHNGWVTAATEEATSWVKKPGRPLDDADNYLFPAEHYEEFPAMPNIALGVTIENRRFVHRADLLRETPAAVRFVSAEPLLGPLVPGVENFRPDGDLGEWLWPDGKLVDEEENPALDLTDIDWLITGGESGAAHRRFDPRWALDLRDWCMAVDPQGRRLYPTAFFHKQNGGRTPKAGGRLLDGRTWDEFPAALSPTTGAA